MSKPLIGFSEWAREVCELLGENPREVRKITITIPHDGGVTAEITKIMREKDGIRLIKVIKEVSWEQADE